MKCRYSENDVALFVEGDLDHAKANDMEAHLVACDACRILANDVTELIQDVDAFQLIETRR